MWSIEKIRFRVGGEHVDVTPGDELPDPRTLESVRAPASGDLSMHTPVHAYCITTGTLLHLESGLELELVTTLDRDPDCRWIVAQPVKVVARGDETPKISRYLDLLSVDRAGSVTLWDVRAPARRTGRFPQESEVARQAAEALGWTYELFGGHDRAHSLNLRWLACYRGLLHGWVTSDLWRRGTLLEG